MNVEDKIKYFEFFVHEMYEWQDQQDRNDLSVLKLMKLLFFVTAVDASKDSESILIKKVFNNYVAMPFGHVESSVYTELQRSKELKFYTIDFSCTKRKNEYTPQSFNDFVNSLDPIYVSAIRNAVIQLSNINSNFISIKAFNLVELSHQWYSWKKNFSAATSSNSLSHPILQEDIIVEDKYFTLQVF